MQIAHVTPFLIAPRPSSDGWSQGHKTLLIKMETTDGLIGWGEAYALTYRQDACRHIILHLAEDLKALPNATPRAFLAHIADPMATKHPSIDYAAAVSGIEIALWDLMAKRAGLPLYALLGGAVRDEVPLYANAWDNPTQSPDAIAERCARLTAEGYTAVKLYPMRQPSLDMAERAVRLARDALGDETNMMLDFAVQKDTRDALKAARAFASYDPYWIEEPLAGNDIPALAEFRSKIGIRITTGERQSGPRHFRDVLSHRAADVLNPDVAGAGGLITMLEIGAMADAHSTMISPHNWNSTTVAYMAMLHLCAVMPNASYAELYYDYLELGSEFATCDSQIKNGFATLPQTPGLGVEIDEETLERLC